MVPGSTGDGRGHVQIHIMIRHWFLVTGIDAMVPRVSTLRRSLGPRDLRRVHGTYDFLYALSGNVIPYSGKCWPMKQHPDVDQTGASS